jgi:hypothetical protein
MKAKKTPEMTPLIGPVCSGFVMKKKTFFVSILKTLYSSTIL